MIDMDRYTEDYIKPSFESVKVKYRKRKILEQLSGNIHNNILEIGCGLDPLFQYVDYENYYLFEPSKIFYENAVSLAQGKNILCINDFFGKNSIFKHEKLDFIVCAGLLHEVEEPEDILQGIFNVCSSDTIVHINVPNANSLHRLLGISMNLIDSKYEISSAGKKRQQHRVFDINILKELVEKNGFEIIDEGSCFIKPFSHKQMMDMLNTECIDNKVLDGLYELSNLIPQYGSEIFVNVRKAR